MLVCLLKYLVVEATGSECTDNAVHKRRADSWIYWLHTSAVHETPNSFLASNHNAVALITTAWVRWWPVSGIGEAETPSFRWNISLVKQNEIKYNQNQTSVTPSENWKRSFIICSIIFCAINFPYFLAYSFPIPRYSMMYRGPHLKCTYG
jgi:hypothetical protein